MAHGVLAPRCHVRCDAGKLEVVDEVGAERIPIVDDEIWNQCSFQLLATARLEEASGLFLADHRESPARTVVTVALLAAEASRDDFLECRFTTVECHAVHEAPELHRQGHPAVGRVIDARFIALATGRNPSTQVIDQHRRASLVGALLEALLDERLGGGVQHPKRSDCGPRGGRHGLKWPDSGNDGFLSCGAYAHLWPVSTTVGRRVERVAPRRCTLRCPSAGREERRPSRHPQPPPDAFHPRSSFRAHHEADATRTSRWVANIGGGVPGDEGTRSALIEEATLPAKQVVRGEPQAVGMLLAKEPGLQDAGQLAVGGQGVTLEDVTGFGPRAQGDDGAVSGKGLDGGAWSAELLLKCWHTAEARECRLAEEGEPGGSAHASANLPGDVLKGKQVHSWVAKAPLADLGDHPGDIEFAIEGEAHMSRAEWQEARELECQLSHFGGTVLLQVLGRKPAAHRADRVSSFGGDRCVGRLAEVLEPVLIARVFRIVQQE